MRVKCDMNVIETVLLILTFDLSPGYQCMGRYCWGQGGGRSHMIKVNTGWPAVSWETELECLTAGALNVFLTYGSFSL